MAQPPAGGDREKQIDLWLPEDLYEQVLLASVVSGRTLEELILELLARAAALESIRRSGDQELPG